MGREFFAVTVVTLMSVACLCGTGFTLGLKAANSQWRKEMVRRGYAEHDAKTGVWKWTDGNGSLEANKE